METDAVKTRHHRINLNYHESNPRNAKLSFSIAISPYLHFFFFFVQEDLSGLNYPISSMGTMLGAGKPDMIFSIKELSV